MMLFFVALTIAIIWLLSPDKDAEARIKYLHSLNLKITGIVKKSDAASGSRSWLWGYLFAKFHKQ